MLFRSPTVAAAAGLPKPIGSGGPGLAPTGGSRAPYGLVGNGFTGQRSQQRPLRAQPDPTVIGLCGLAPPGLTIPAVRHSGSAPGSAGTDSEKPRGCCGPGTRRIGFRSGCRSPARTMSASCRTGHFWMQAGAPWSVFGRVVIWAEAPKRIRRPYWR